MKKWLRRLLLAVALLVVVLQIALWAASVRWGNLIVLYPTLHRQFVTVECDRGVWRINRFYASSLEGAFWTHNIGPFLIARTFDRRSYDRGDPPKTWQELLLPQFQATVEHKHPGWYLGIPILWTLALNLVPVIICLKAYLRAHRNRQRLRSGLCEKCGYDLRGTPQRCPECGAAGKAADPAGASPAGED